MIFDKKEEIWSKLKNKMNIKKLKKHFGSFLSFSNGALYVNPLNL